MDLLERRGADAAFRRVDDPLEGKIVFRRLQKAQISHRVADFLRFIESRPDQHAIGNAELDKAFLELPRLETGAHHDRDFAEGMPARCRASISSATQRASSSPSHSV